MLVLNGFSRLMACFLCHRALLFQRQADATLLEHLIHRRYGIQHLGEADERCGEVHHFAQFFGSDAHIERCSGVGFQLRERLQRGKGDAGNHFALFHSKITRLEHFAEDELLKNIHHFRVCSLPRKGFASEQGAVILLAYFDSIHIVCCLCHRGQAAYQCEGDYTYYLLHILCY